MSSLRLTALFIFAVSVFEASTNIFLPSLSLIQDFYHTTAAHTKLTVSMYLLGLASLGIIGGPLSDHIGRRPVMLLGISLFWLGSFLSFLVAKESLDLLIAARFLQGLGAGLATILTIVILKDLFDEVTCARLLSLMGMVIAVAPMMAPMVGGAIADYYAWNTNFLIMFIAASALLLLFIKEAPESHFTREPFYFRAILKGYVVLLKNKQCLFHCLMSMSVYGALFAWIVHAPFYFEEVFHMNTFSYGVFAALGPVTYILGSFLNYIFLHRWGLSVLTQLGIYLSLGATLFLLMIALIFPTALWGYLIGFLIFNMGLAPVFSNAATRALEFAEDRKGAASAMIASLEQGFAAFAAFAVSFAQSSSMLFPIAFMVGAVTLSYTLFKNVSKMEA